MGLSDEERTEKIFFSVWRMTQPDKIRQLRGKYKELADLLDQLWPAFLSGKSNGLYWFMGSGVTDEVMERPTIFNTAIIGNRSRGTPDWSDELFKKREEEIEAMPESAKKQALLKSYDLIEYQSKYHPTYESILRRNAPDLAVIYTIHEECEYIRYALNRYRDDFAKDGWILDALVCNILGRCFDYFTSDSRFREAWYTAQICDRIMHRRVNADTTIVKIWSALNIQHEVGIGVHSLEALHDYWVKIQQKQELTTEEQVLATLWLTQRRFHYEHQFNALLRHLKEHNKANPDDKVSLVKVERMFRSHNAPANKAYNKRSEEIVQYCRLSGNTVTRNWSQTKPKKKGKKK